MQKQAQDLNVGDVVVINSHHHYDPPDIVARVVFVGRNRNGHYDLVLVDENNQYRTHQMTVIATYPFPLAALR